MVCEPRIVRNIIIIMAVIRNNFNIFLIAATKNVCSYFQNYYLVISKIPVRTAALDASGDVSLVDNEEHKVMFRLQVYYNTFKPELGLYSHLNKHLDIA